ncbi:putative EXG1-exo-beta-1,3-glucanase, major isoform [Ceraceosorus guamensis]|uniref:Putative EXG1-exo-beta-1,3-glucanase, major isoform n=1 Tax=Ceraceosorus guamensis TaxID=1522189 RepID=A0A316WA85_9BASI|nr:putative EXG1-exo-beta-1,3-glucanase, major isoform [Ceraceosorus guamensis]PWN45968.1 putative EXG1-exo-beta-1,3-glucanase, major isoform [Ceraceosorus guamensis]
MFCLKKMLALISLALTIVNLAVAAPAREPLFIRTENPGSLNFTAQDFKRDILIDLQPRQNPSWNYGTQKVRGVNLGGWLVAEPWITPSLFDNTGDGRVVDEWTFGQYVGDAESRLQQHWATWITEDDLRQIKAAGLNHVRIQIGYWAFEKGSGDQYVKSNQLSYLDKGVTWARNQGLKVQIDLHGVPGSQNGFDNSGRRGNADWFFNQGFADRAKNVLQTLAQRYVNDRDTVTQIQLLNEPLTTNGDGRLDFTRSFYNDAYYAVRYARGSQPTDYSISIHDGFQPLSAWQGQFQPPQYEQVVLDTHIYTMFDVGKIAQTQEERLRGLCQNRALIGQSQPNLWTIVGEWTAAFTDCAKYLNGRGIGARYDGSFPGSTRRGACDASKSGNGNGFSSQYKANLKRMFDTQRSVYETGSGWIMWTWKAAAADWSYKRLLELGVITYNLNDAGDVFC